ncbi:S8 family serine peptidase [Pseudobacteroides cellulosolvens]|uniref:Thermitase n=1 Tax=Pseudobacteroides cellulosolvens ATCC 35603 = DSM 2933 TaxID=398512 RepID=A0A0L6JWZ5_9FIRM|nr:S8 family serine peptidase [Pseudobacteroides cellulosolvens]KNY30125.1 Thermitase [Pseudobacteroides cellulosolvens ATCC 35603 = DSM 2933]
MSKGRKLVSFVVLFLFISQIFLTTGIAFSTALEENPNETVLSDKTVKESSLIPTLNPVNETSTAKTSVSPTPSISDDNVDDEAKDLSKSESILKNEAKVSKKEVIVKYKNKAKRTTVKERITSKRSARKLMSKKYLDNFQMEVVEIEDGESMDSILDELKSDPDIEYAQPDFKLNSYVVPQDDDRYAEQWGLSNSGQNVMGQVGTAGVDIRANEAWDLTMGSENITVAVIDSGIDIKHKDLSNNIYTNAEEIVNGIDDDGNGFVDDVNGWDFANNDNSVYDSESQDSHGTHVAGIIAAGVNNSGITGISPLVKVLPIKFINGSNGYTSDALNAISYAESMGATIANISWGGNEYNPALKEAIEKSGMVFVCAAGNMGTYVDSDPIYPACFGLSNIISVAAVDNRGELASFSSYGSRIDVAAPGVNILSTLPGNKYGYMSGTSMAAPFVSGVAALMSSVDINLSVAQIKSRIRNNVTKISGLEGKVSTSGLLNAKLSILNQAPIGEPSSTILPTPTLIPGEKQSPTDYSVSLAGNHKVNKPIVRKSNLFIDSLLKNPNNNVLNTKDGINNISISRMKGNYLAVTWTTDVDSGSEVYYGKSNLLEKNIKVNELTKKHQIILKESNTEEIKFLKLVSITKDNQEYSTQVLNVKDYVVDMGGTAPSVPEKVEIKRGLTSLQDVSTLSYIMDNNANHSFSSPQLINQGTVFGTMDTTYAQDIYSISLQASTAYKFTLTGIAQGDDYDLYLYNSSGIEIGRSTYSSNYDESITYTPTVTGTYFISVEKFTFGSSSQHHNYQLMAYATNNSPDSFEPNDSEDTAKPITVNTTINPTLNISTDEDWFELNTAKTGKISVTMKSIPVNCDYDVEVYKGDGSLIGGSYASSNKDEVSACLINAPGKYYIRVYSYSGFSPSDTYELKAVVVTPDEFEPNEKLNDVMSESRPEINLETSSYGTIDNVDDTDCYSFLVSRNTKVSVKLQNVPYGTDYDVYLYSYEGGEFVEVGRSTVPGNSDENIEVDLSTGKYYLKVNSWSGFSELDDYKLTLKDLNLGKISIDLDRTIALKGDIITATIKGQTLPSISGYQFNLKYNPKVVQPVMNDMSPFTQSTLPAGRTVLLNQSHSLFTNATNDLTNGTLNFAVGYTNIDSYKQSGVYDKDGIFAVIKFKVLMDYQIQFAFQNCETMPNALNGVYLFNVDGQKINSGLAVSNSKVANLGFPAYPQTVTTNSIENEIPTVDVKSGGAVAITIYNRSTTPHFYNDSEIF